VSPAATARIDDGPIRLPGGWIAGAATGLGSSGAEPKSWIFDRAARAYTTVPYGEVVPAPTTNLAAVFDDAKSRYGLLDVAVGTVRWLKVPGVKEGVYSAPAWSADSAFLAVLSRPKTESMSVFVVEVATGNTHHFAVDAHCADLCFISWRDRDTLALPHSPGGAGEAGAPYYDGMQLFSASTGESTGTIDLPGSFASAAGWSPDRRHVVLATSEPVPDSPTSNQVAIYDVAAHRVVGKLPPLVGVDNGSIRAASIVWLTNDRALVPSPEGVSMVGVDATEIGFYPMPSEFDGHPWLILIKI
jgi:hypothetical protein